MEVDNDNEVQKRNHFLSGEGNDLAPDLTGPDPVRHTNDAMDLDPNPLPGSGAAHHVSPPPVPPVNTNTYSLDADRSEAPDFLTTDIIQYLRELSSDPAWQTLVDNYLKFEKANNITGVSCSFFS